MGPGKRSYLIHGRGIAGMDQVAQVPETAGRQKAAEPDCASQPATGAAACDDGDRDHAHRHEHGHLGADRQPAGERGDCKGGGLDWDPPDAALGGRGRQVGRPSVGQDRDRSQRQASATMSLGALPASPHHVGVDDEHRSSRVTGASPNGRPMHQAASSAEPIQPKLRRGERRSLPRTTMPIEWISSELSG